MPAVPPKLTQISLAAVRLETMIDFYNGVFDAALVPLAGFSDDEVMYRGTLAGLPLMVVPNEIAGVDAEQSRHQLHLSVEDMDTALGLVQELGGAVEEEVEGNVRTVVIRDPDGNTLVLTTQ